MKKRIIAKNIQEYESLVKKNKTKQLPKEGDKLLCYFSHNEEPWIAEFVSAKEYKNSNPFFTVKNRPPCEACGREYVPEMNITIDASWFEGWNK